VRHLRALALVLAWVLGLAAPAAMLCPRVAQAAGDAVEVEVPAATAATAQEGNEGVVGEKEAVKTDGEEVRASAEIPPERLIEPPPMKRGEPLPDEAVSALVCPVREFYQHFPTGEEWNDVLRVLFGPEAVPQPPLAAPAPPPPPMPGPPAQPPAPPRERKQPPAEPEAAGPALIGEDVRTEEAVSLAMQIKSRGLSDDYARVVMSQGRVSGNTGAKQYDMVGDLTLYYQDITAQAGRGHIDQNTEVIKLSDSIVLTNPKYSLECEELTVRFKEKSFTARTFVHFQKHERGSEPTDTSLPKRERVINIFKNDPTEVYASTLDYNWESEEMTAAGEVRVVQEKVSATMDRLDYSPEAKTYRMKGNIFATLLDTDWIFEHELVEERDVELAKALTEEETTLEADYLETGEDSDLMTMRGAGEVRARITQEDKELVADEITFDDRRKVMSAEGTVSYWQQSGEWLRKGGLVEREPDEEGKRYLESEVTSRSDHLTFDYDQRVLHQWGNVEVVSGDEMLIADDLVYKEKEKLLHLTGQVGYFRGREEYLFADEAIIDAEHNRFQFIGVLESFVFTSKEEREKAQAAEEEARSAEASATGAGAEGAAEGENPPEAGLLTQG